MQSGNAKASLCITSTPCAGKVKLRGFFVGQAMKASKGRANPAELNRVLDERLAASKPQ